MSVAHHAAVNLRLFAERRAVSGGGFPAPCGAVTRSRLQSASCTSASHGQGASMTKPAASVGAFPPGPMCLRKVVEHCESRCQPAHPLPHLPLIVPGRRGPSPTVRGGARGAGWPRRPSGGPLPGGPFFFFFGPLPVIVLAASIALSGFAAPSLCVLPQPAPGAALGDAIVHARGTRMRAAGRGASGGRFSLICGLAGSISLPPAAACQALRPARPAPSSAYPPHSPALPPLPTS